MNLKNLLTIVFISAMFFSCSVSGTGDGKENFFTIKNGELERPTDYRSWVYVGTPVTPNDMNNGKAAFPEFHNVYIDPVSYAYWKEKGEFRDGTILIKELVSVGSKKAVSGNGYFMGDFIGLEATIKSKKHFSGEPGNWAYFSFTIPGKNEVKDKAKQFPTNACNSCHQTSAADDFVFTQYYPVLSSAKKYGMKNPENTSSRLMGEAMMGSAMDNQWEAAAETPANVDSEVPVNLEKLFTYLQQEKYKNFKNHESVTHPSAGPHTKEGLPVKVFMNDRLAMSLKNNNQEHPLGSAVVKEMYNIDNNLAGWAVMVKTDDKTDDGNGWFWYEVTSTTDGSQIPASGNGVPGCIGCHMIGGRDLIRTTFPLK